VGTCPRFLVTTDFEKLLAAMMKLVADAKAQVDVERSGSRKNKTQALPVHA
jgi:predicted RNA-binding protein YlqC (UPF0109 family)